MAIDSIIEFDCAPKRALSAAGIVQRLKERAQAESVIASHRASDDQRPIAEMHFEFSRSTPGNPGAIQLIAVSDVLEYASDLDDYARHCQACPASRGIAYGCVGFVRYPISALAENWLLERLPVPDEPLVWLLLKQGIQKLGYDGASLRALRQSDANRSYFELAAAPRRRLGELRVSGDQALEMILGVGERIIPNHSGILLLFFGAIDRDLEAQQIQEISSYAPDIRQRAAFTLDLPANPDGCIRELAALFHALYVAWKLNVPLFIDA
ncbi:MAG: hypothetical protein OXG92_05610 [Chloroflexi bacterium]|nr:hypothetical protein [Chloroflexota bacterium]MCY3582927.1 hypothetical protein [Chloroflexota bacterium]MCY3715923.1 hypothetical protein [Chloroflexota bacterium]MDE2649706.1 hypothetical protein [Chloroflexota bacterium]MXV92368.1 hypothetical protein [Chloroflexota bacterium]